MLNIVICEDNNIQRSTIEKFIKNSIAKNDFSFRIKLSTNDPEVVLKNIGNGDIYFLDVDLNNKINGFKLAERIRNIDSLGYIIFITTHSELTYLTFKYRVEAMDFILKDNINEIEDYYHMRTEANKDFSALSGAEIIHNKLPDEYHIWNHAKAVDLVTNGRLRGNMQYKEDKWYV